MDPEEAADDIIDSAAMLPSSADATEPRLGDDNPQMQTPVPPFTPEPASSASAGSHDTEKPWQTAKPSPPRAGLPCGFVETMVNLQRSVTCTVDLTDIVQIITTVGAAVAARSRAA